jgi:hypothetical protein
MDVALSIQCRCRILQGQIVFCQLHREAERLLGAVDYLRKYLATLKVARVEDQNTIREVVCRMRPV